MISKIVTLGDVCNKGSSNIAQKDLVDRDGIYPIYGAAGYIKNVDFAHQDKPYLAVVKDGAGIGRVMKLPANSSIIGTMQYILPKGNIDIDYLYFALQYMNLSKYFSGSTIPHIYFRDYQKEKLPLPELSEQQGKAYVLLRIEQLIECYRQQLTKLDELVKSQFVEMFGDPVSNAKAWQMRPLKETCALMTGNTPSRAVKEYYGSYIEWIKSDNIANSSLYLTAAAESLSEKGAEVGRVVHPGTILMTCIAGSLNTIGNVAIVDRDVAFNQQINAIIPHQYDTLFLCYLLKLLKPKLHEAASSALKCILNKGNLEAFTAIVPDMALQKEFSSFVVQSDKSKLVVQQSLEKLETLKKSLMQQYFG